MKNPPENGDWVRADEYQDSDSVNYKITTLKRDPLPTEIVRLKFLPAVFREDVKRWYIEFQSPEHETRQQLLLGDYDVMLFKLKPEIILTTLIGAVRKSMVRSFGVTLIPRRLRPE